MKNSTSITLEEKMIESIEKMMVIEQRSFSSMVAYLIGTNPKYVNFNMGEKRKEKVAGRK